MRLGSGGALFLLLALGTAPEIPAGTAYVDVALDPAELTVGDRVEARLTLVWDGDEPASAPLFPDWSETWGRAEVLEQGEVEISSRRAGRYIYTQSLTLTAFETGEIELPSQTVTLSVAGETVEIPTRATSFMVRSVLPDEGEESEAELLPRPAAPPRTLPEGRRFLWAAVAIAGLSVLAGFLLAYRLRRAALEPAAPAPRRILEPLEECLEALRSIDANAGGEPAHTALSMALRRYLGRCLEINAVESTTSEIRRALRRGPLVDDQVEEAAALLADCDQVKYARQSVDAARIAERLTLASRLARRIDRHLRPSEPAPDLGAVPPAQGGVSPRPEGLSRSSANV